MKATVGLTLLAFSLRLMNLGGPSLWYDEAYQVLVSATLLPALLERVASDTNQPLSFLLLHFWGAGSASEFYLRFPSVLAGTLAVPLLYTAGRFLLPMRAALAAALLLSIAPVPLFYSQELRMYGESLALAALAGCGFAAAWLHGRRWGWLAYGLGTTLALYTHVLAALPCLALAAWAVADARGHPERLRPLGLTVSLAIVAFVPWGAVIAGQIATVVTSFWAPAPSVLAPLLSLHQVLFGPFGGALLFVPGLGLTLLALALSLPGLRAGRPHARSLGLLWVWAVLPVLTLFAFSQVRSVYLDRVLIGISLPLCLLLGWVTVSLRPRLLGLGIGLALIGLAVGGLSNWYLDPAAGKPPYRDAAHMVLAQARSGEPVLHTSDGSLLPFMVYSPLQRQVLLAGDPEHVATTSRARSTLVTHGITPVPLAQAIAAHQSFWLVVALDHSPDYQRTVAAEIDSQYRRTADLTAGGVVVRRYAR